MGQIEDNTKLHTLDLPELKTVLALWVRTRLRLRSADRARAATRIAPSLYYC